HRQKGLNPGLNREPEQTESLPDMIYGVKQIDSSRIGGRLATLGRLRLWWSTAPSRSRYSTARVSKGSEAAWIVIICLLVAVCAAPRVSGTPSDTLRNFLPSPIRSAYGKVSRIEFSSEMMELKSGALAYCAEGSMKSFRFEEPVWI